MRNKYRYYKIPGDTKPRWRVNKMKIEFNYGVHFNDEKYRWITSKSYVSETAVSMRNKYRYYTDKVTTNGPKWRRIIKSFSEGQVEYNHNIEGRPKWKLYRNPLYGYLFVVRRGLMSTIRVETDSRGRKLDESNPTPAAKPTLKKRNSRSRRI